MTAHATHKLALNALRDAKPLEFPGSEMDGRPGMTAIGVCYALGIGGSDAGVYRALKELVALGQVKKGCSYTDSIFYL